MSCQSAPAPAFWKGEAFHNSSPEKGGSISPEIMPLECGRKPE
ncbi:unnamed protein product [Staurois parvus]|uniref:Uncharacterized protein n=1 Tax=Staurois parvus TaxID=386267 RepID=A0ABN9HC65_9NEOB|nr:unnamed protein product [Staurois parvus]